MAHKHKLTVVLVNMGGPESLEEIEPFLLNLFNDPDIIEIFGGRLLRPYVARMIVKKRLPEVTENYRLIGGGSPLLKITQQQAEALQNALSEHFDADVRIAMRYTRPFTDEAFQGIPNGHPVMVLPLYPHFSSTTTGSSFNEIYRHFKKHRKPLDAVTFIRDYHDHPTFIRAWSEQIRRTLKEMPEDHLRQAVFLYSAHGVPEYVIRRGDPYQQQVERSVKLIHEALGLPNPYMVTYQSKVGRRKWLEPSTEHQLIELGKVRTPAVVVVPISFVSEHSETLYELDMMLKDIALDAGVQAYYRVPTFNDFDLYIQTLKEVVLQHGKTN